ncbi:MAG: PH domain-containing protein [Phycisphaerales bacterium]
MERQQPASTLPGGDPPVQRIDLGPGEELVLVLRPHWLFVLLDRPAVLMASIAVAAAGGWWAAGAIRAFAMALPLLWLVWQLLERASRRYVLTDRRVVMVAGLLRQVIVDAPLEHVRQVSLFRTIPERLLDLGTVSFATAGTGGQDVIWRVVERPAGRLREARDALDRAIAAAARRDEP